MLNKPKILSINPQFGSNVSRKYNLFSGVGYYRQRMAAKYLKEYTFVHVGKELLVPKDEMQETVAHLVKDVQLVHTQHIDNPHLVVALLGACDFYNVPLLIDFDDHVLTDDGLSPDRYVYPEGSSYRHTLETLMREATGITVSTIPLMEVYRKFNKNIYLIPNACDMSDWKLAGRHHERATVGWAGSASHAKDHSVLEDVYADVIKKNPDVVFSFVGHMLPEHIKNMPRRNWEIKPGITWWEGNPDSKMTYPRLLAESGYDVGLAPLIESQFNGSRSLAKWFEYTMVGIPMVASEWGPYLALKDGKEAYLVQTQEGWIDAINQLLQNKDVRTKFVTNSRERIAREFSIEHTVPTWRDVFSRHIGHGFPK